jgi:hypothetical protein
MKAMDRELRNRSCYIEAIKSGTPEHVVIQQIEYNLIDCIVFLKHLVEQLREYKKLK